MKFLFASDSFKGTLSSERITQLLEAAAEQTFPGCETAGVPVADGGEGTIDAVISALNGTYRRLTVHGPLMEEAQSFYGEFEGDSAIIEMAAASGLPMVPADRRNPLNTTTYGLSLIHILLLPSIYRPRGWTRRVRLSGKPLGRES